MIFLLDKKRGAPASTTTPWYLAGGVSAPQAAYQAKGAASLAASYVNLANPGTNNASPSGTEPAFSTANGWTFSGAAHLASGATFGAAWTMYVRFTQHATFSYVVIQQGAALRVQNGAAGSGYHVVYLSGNERAWTYSAGQDTVICLAGNNVYQDGVLVGAVAGTPDGTTVRIGATGTSSPHLGYIKGYALYATEHNATQVAAISAAMANF